MGTVRAFAVVTVSSNTCCFSPFGRVARSTNRRRLLRPLLTSAVRSENLAVLSVSMSGQARQTSRGKFLRLPRATAGFTFCALDGYGLRCQLPARPTLTPQIRFLYVGSRFCSMLLSDDASRQSPLHFANPSPPSGWIRDLHPQTEKHARHTTKNQPGVNRADFNTYPDFVGLNCRDGTTSNPGNQLNLQISDQGPA